MLCSAFQIDVVRQFEKRCKTQATYSHSFPSLTGVLKSHSAGGLLWYRLSLAIKQDNIICRKK